MLLESDRKEIEDLMQNGLSLRQVAKKYDVPESSLRYFLKPKPSAQSAQNSAQTVRNYAQYPVFAGVPFFNQSMPMPQQIQIPHSNDPQVLSYMLQLKSFEADTATKRLADLEVEYRKLRSDYTDLEISQKHFDREKTLAVEDAIRENKKGTFDAEKALTIVSSSPVLSSALAGVISKVMNIDAGAALGGAPTPSIDNPTIMELAKYLSTKDEDTINKVVAVAFRLADDSQWLEQSFQAVKG